MKQVSIDSLPGSTGLESRRVYSAALAVVVLAGAFLRFWNLGLHSLWLDEAWLAKTLINSTTLRDVVINGPGDVPNSTPFLTSIAIHYLTRILGDSEWALRFLPALFSVGAILVIYALVRRFGGAQPTALFAAILTAFNTEAIYYAQELKQYAGDTFWVPLFMLGVLIYVDRPTWWKAIAVGLGGLIGLGFSQPIALVLPGATLLVLYSSVRSRSLTIAEPKVRIAPSIGLIGIWVCGAGLFYGLIFRHQSTSGLVNFWNEFFPASKSPGDMGTHLVAQMGRFFKWLFVPEAWNAGLSTALGDLAIDDKWLRSISLWSAGICAAIGFFYLLVKRTSQTVCFIVVLWCVALGMSVIRKFPFGGVRVNLYMFPILVMMVVFGAEAILRSVVAMMAMLRSSQDNKMPFGETRIARGLLAAGLTGATVVMAVPIYYKQLTDPKNKEELRPMVERMFEEYQDGDAVALLDPNTRYPFDYYTRRRRVPYEILKSNWRDELILHNLRKLARSHRRVWIPMSHFRQERIDAILAIVGQRWPSLVVVEGRGAKLAFFEADTGLTMLPKASLEIDAPNHRDDAMRTIDDDAHTRWSSDGPRQAGWSMEIGLAEPVAARVIVLTAPNYPPDWSRELHVSYEHSTGDGWRSNGASVYVGPRTVILFDSAVGPIERVRITNLDASTKFCWSIHEIEVWVPEAGE